MGSGALVHDALKIGIDPGEQRRMMNEALDVSCRCSAARPSTARRTGQT
jgi:hypothetical protein